MFSLLESTAMDRAQVSPVASAVKVLTRSVELGQSQTATTCPSQAGIALERDVFRVMCIMATLRPGDWTLQPRVVSNRNQIRRWA